MFKQVKLNILFAQSAVVGEVTEGNGQLDDGKPV